MWKSVRSMEILQRRSIAIENGTVKKSLLSKGTRALQFNLQLRQRSYETLLNGNPNQTQS